MLLYDEFGAFVHPLAAFCLTAVTDESTTLQHHLEQPMASAKSVLEMIAAMNKGGASKRVLLNGKDIEMFAKPRPKKKKHLKKKSPLPLRKTVSSKARKKFRKKKS